MEGHEADPCSDLVYITTNVTSMYDRPFIEAVFYISVCINTCWGDIWVFGWSWVVTVVTAVNYQPE